MVAHQSLRYHVEVRIMGRGIAERRRALSDQFPVEVEMQNARIIGGNEVVGAVGMTLYIYVVVAFVWIIEVYLGGGWTSNFVLQTVGNFLNVT